MIDLDKMYRTFICRTQHKIRIMYDRKTRLVDAGMRKEIVTYYRCPKCGRKWQEVEYV